MRPAVDPECRLAVGLIGFVGSVAAAMLAAATLLSPTSVVAAEELKVGSKRFTESYILGEIITLSARNSGTDSVHRPGMGNTAILFEALKAGAIDLYPDYTGTVARQLLGTEATDLASLNRGLQKFGLGAAIRLGFNNTYALALSGQTARRLQLYKLSDLAAQPQLRFGLSHEFLERSDGWRGLKQIYALPQSPVGVDHGLAYEAIAAGQIDVMDIYSTDAKIARYGLRVLEDDRRFFPDYDAVLVYRLDVPQRFPAAWRALLQLEGRIGAKDMIRMNARAELENADFAEIAAEFVGGAGANATTNAVRVREAGFLRVLFAADFWRLTGQHLMLVFVSLAAALAMAIPLGIWAARNASAGAAILSLVGVIQTIPALALLAFLIPLLGRIGTVPALAALFLYSLLPIVRNTHSGLIDIDPALRESAHALGLPARARLRLVELPLAARSILAGVKTSAVINVGTATIAAFIGAGGYGERIVTGLALNNHGLLLAGAIPAALLALLVQGLFDLIDRFVVSDGLR